MNRRTGRRIKRMNRKSGRIMKRMIVEFNGNE